MAEDQDEQDEQDESKHQKLVNLGLKHEDSKKLEGGKCLQRCVGEYREKCSCSYRWQAAHRALNIDPQMYDLDDVSKTYERYVTAYEKDIPEDTKKGTKAKKANVKGYENRGYTRCSKNGDGISMKKDVKAFETGCKPWSNNAHHIVPMGSIRSAILDVVGDDNAKVAQPIMQDLMDSPYNVNYWENMIILPCEFEIGARLGLPIHPPKFHSVYSGKIQKELRQIFLEAYDDEVKDAAEKNEDHKSKLIEGDVVKSIEKMQLDIYDAIKKNKKTFQSKKTADDLWIDCFASTLVK